MARALDLAQKGVGQVSPGPLVGCVIVSAQGEIAGEYFLSNSNLKSHLVRAHVTPSEAVGGGVMFYKFDLDRPQGTAPATDVAFELDAYADWKVNGNFTISVVGAVANPGEAVQQSSGRTRNFGYGMVYVGYRF